MVRYKNDSFIKLSDLCCDNEAVIVKIKGTGAFRKRLLEMGFIRGKKIKVIKNAPLQDPIEYQIMGYNISLRRNEADLVLVLPLTNYLEEHQSRRRKRMIMQITNRFMDFNNFADLHKLSYQGTIDENTLKTSIKDKTNEITVALVGNPNSGKTTIFNFASGQNERVANYSGVTVQAKEGKIEHNDYKINMFDLPGTYSITEYTPEELYVRQHIFEKQPDIIVNVVDASNLERNLYLTTQLIDMNLKVVIALNMYDELEKSGAKFDYKHLAEMIGIPIIPTIARKGEGIKELLDKIIDVYEDKDPIVRHIHINYGDVVESSIKSLQKLIKQNEKIKYLYSTRYIAIKLLEKDKEILKILANCHNVEDIKKQAEIEIKKIEEFYKDQSDNVITDLKFGFISGALKQTYQEGKIDTRKLTAQIDKFVTNKYLGFPIFILFIWLSFEATFYIGSFPADWLEYGVENIKNFVSNYIPDGSLKDLILDGIIGGVGNVLVFLPNIMILFFFISFLEDIGYMARAAFIVDKIMHKIGLHGKSFIPLMMGFGCNVPAVMATRTLENPKDRILTMLIIPFMSCSARLPVYLLFISAFFEKNQGLILTSIYLTGIIFAGLISILFNKLFFKGQDVPFVMELPPYRFPTLKNSLLQMWSKASAYIKKMGTVILGISIIIWFFSNYPKDEKLIKQYDDKIQSVTTATNLDSNAKNNLIAEIEKEKLATFQQNTILGKLGMFIEPAIKPLGFDWRVGIAILSGLSAKEVIISTLSIIYKTGDDEFSLKEKLKMAEFTDGENKGKPVFTPLTVLTLLIFVLFYFPCVATVVAIKNESNWKWALFSIFYSTFFAYLLAFVFYNIGKLFI